MIEGTLKRLSDPFYAGSAAETAFWLLLSLVPSTILIAQILDIFSLSMVITHDVLSAYMSSDVYKLIAPLVDYSPRRGATVLLAILALIAGSNAVYTLMRIINRSYGAAAPQDRQAAVLTIGKRKAPAWWSGRLAQGVRDRLRAILMTLLMLITILFALYILVYGELFVKAALAYTNDFLGNNYTFSDVWYGMRWIIALILFFIMVFSLYYILPRSGMSYRGHFIVGKLAAVKNILVVWLKGRRREYGRAMPGSIFAAAGMLIVTRIYTLFVRGAAQENINFLYGGLSSVVVLLLWFYAMAYVLIAGIQVNATYEEYTKDQDEENGEEE